MTVLQYHMLHSHEHVIHDKTISLIISCSLLICFVTQESSVREPSESKLCKPAGLCAQHHGQSAIHERRGSKQCHAGMWQ